MRAGRLEMMCMCVHFSATQENEIREFTLMLKTCDQVFFFFSLPPILNLSKWFCRGELSVVWALRRWIKAAGTWQRLPFML